MSEENIPSVESAGGQMQNEGEGMGGSSSSSKMKAIVAVVIVLVVAGALYAMTRTDTSSPEAGEEPEAVTPTDQAVTATENTAVANQPETAAPAAPVESAVTVAFNDTGYVPAEVTIKKGQTVNFKNESAIATWPASAMHPTHTVYPGSGIEKCGTDEQAGIFDACRGLNTGESWSFQFNEIGAWKYHDHLNAGQFGTIIVAE